MNYRRIIEAAKNTPAILEGYIRGTFNLRDMVMIYREEYYCQKCPLAFDEDKYTGVCQEDKGGCGCGIKAKTSQSKSDCPKGFWTQEDDYPEKFKEFINEHNK